MKKALIVMAFLGVAIATKAQQGNWYIGGIGGINSSTDKNPAGFKTTTSTWAFGPEVGTFLKDDIQLGAILALGGSSTKNDTQDLLKSSSFNPTIYGRKFFKIGDNLSTFAGVYLNFISGTSTDYTPTTTESTDSGFGLKLGIGIAYALSDKFTAVGQYGLLGYQSVSHKVGGADAGTTTDFSFGVNTVGYNSSLGTSAAGVFNIGLYYTFMKK